VAVAQLDAAAGGGGHVRNELVSLVAESGRVMTAHELAAALRVHHGAAEDESPERTLAKASAVVRAAVEAETWPDSRDGAGAEAEPRLAVRRRGQRVLIALESLPGTDDPAPLNWPTTPSPNAA
jgi:hypothetical protein